MLSRRGVLSGLFGSTLVAGVVPAAAATSRPRERGLAFENLHTGETIRDVYWAEGGYRRDVLDRISWVLRDHRTNEALAIEPALLDVLHVLGSRIAAPGCCYQVISGYRSPRTNARLAAASGGVAQNSLHTRGMAIDVRVEGVDLPVLRDAAKSLRAGGVGYYSRSGFVHVDIGRVRYW